MPAYNFQARFAQDVADGKKRQTIRAFGKRRHAKPGEALQLYTGMRTKHCRKLIAQDPVCIAAQPIRLARNPDTGSLLIHTIGKDWEAFKAFRVGRYFTSSFERDACFAKMLGRKPDLGDMVVAVDVFARADGFASAVEMFAWFEKTHGLPFEGVLIKW